MPVIRIKNLNTGLHRRLRLIGSEGSSIESQLGDGSLVQFGSKDIRVCLAPNTTDNPDNATVDTSAIQLLGRFDVTVDGVKYHNLTPESMFTTFNPDSIMEVIGDGTPYNLRAEYKNDG